MGTNRLLRDAVERKSQTASQSNTREYRSGTVTGTTIDFQFRFLGQPDVTLTPWAAGGGATCGGLTIDQDEAGYYVGATIEMSADFVVWTATESGIAAVPE